MHTLISRLRRDGWLLGLLAACVLACLMLGSAPEPAAFTQEEVRLAAILSAIEGAGHVEAAVFYQSGKDAVPTGAVIVAEGASDMGVQVQLSRAAMTLLDLEADRIVICRLKEE